MNRHRGMGRIFVVLALLLVIGVAGGGAALLLARDALQPVSSTHGAPVAIDVHAGESTADVGTDLLAHHLIRSTFWFGIYARYRDLGAHLRQGRYLLDAGMGASAIVTRLEGSPDVATVRLTFAEGLTTAQMGAVVARSGLKVTAAAYVAATQSLAGFHGAFLAGIPAGRPLEGYLFPDTYDVPADASAHDVIQLQLDAFGAKAAGALTSASLTPYQTVILASIVEREAKAAGDRPLVAGVLSNRLHDGMLLQVDASVLFGLGVFGRSPTAAELAQDTPYNTYLHPGLPPGPIANPGVSSITAAADPAQTQYLFYVSDCNGQNHYSVTEAQHEQQIVQYLSTPCSG